MQSIENICPESKMMRLKALYPTQWVEHHDLILVFLELFEAVVDSLETILTWPDCEAPTIGNLLLATVRQSEFVVSLHIISISLQY